MNLKPKFFKLNDSIRATNKILFAMEYKNQINDNNGIYVYTYKTPDENIFKKEIKTQWEHTDPNDNIIFNNEILHINI